MGLIYQVVLAEGLDEAAGELADRLTSSPALAVSLSERLLNDSFQTSIERALDEGRAQAINLTPRTWPRPWPPSRRSARPSSGADEGQGRAAC